MEDELKALSKGYKIIFKQNPVPLFQNKVIKQEGKQSGLLLVKLNLLCPLIPV